MLMTAYAFLALFGLILLVWIIPANTEETGYGLSPALLPYALAFLILFTSLILLWQTWRTRNMGRSTILPRHLIRLAAFSVIFFGAFPLMELVGFLPGAMITLLLLQLMCGQRKLPWLFGIAVGLSLAVWAAMVYVMQIPLP